MLIDEARQGLERQGPRASGSYSNIRMLFVLAVSPSSCLSIDRGQLTNGRFRETLIGLAMSITSA